MLRGIPTGEKDQNAWRYKSSNYEIGYTIKWFSRGIVVPVVGSANFPLNKDDDGGFVSFYRVRHSVLRSCHIGAWRNIEGHEGLFVA